MATVVRIRKGDAYYIGHSIQENGDGRLYAPQFREVKKEDARVCSCKESARALLGMSGFEGAHVEIEEQ